MSRGNKAGTLSFYRDQVYSCVRCGACMAVCPTFKATGRESMVARGRLSLVESVLDGEQELTRGVSRRISECIGCRACESVCPSGLDIVAALYAARADRTAASRSGAALRTAARNALGGREGLPPRAMRLAAALEHMLYERAPAHKPLPYLRQGSKRIMPRMRSRTLMDMIPQPCTSATSVIFFPGCATNIFYPETGLALAAVLASRGIAMHTPRDWRCCGLPFLSLGDRETARMLAEDNTRLLARTITDTGAEAVVTVCSSCALALVKDIPELLGKDHNDARFVAERVMDIHQYLPMTEQEAAAESEESAGGGSEDPSGNLSVAFHDPCHLYWGLGEQRGASGIISRIPGVDYIDAAGGSCCGGGGLFSIEHYDLSLKIGLGRAEELEAAGADIVVTGCPGCRSQLEDMLGRVGSRARVIHTVELLAWRAGVGPDSRLE